MSKIGELMLKQVVKRSLHKKRKEGPGRTHADYIRWQYESSPNLLGKIRNLDLSGKRVLDIGCGTGGRTAYLATLGASEVIGIDINSDEIDIARAEVPSLYPEVASRVSFHASKEDESLAIGQFDVVILIDAMEHVISPPAMMELAYSYLKDGGFFYFTCIGFYHRKGSHMGMMPFVNLFFSDETILNVKRWQVSHPDYQATRFDSDPPIRRWQGLYDLRDRPGEHLNKLTIATVRKMLRYSIFKVNSLDVIGYNKKGLVFNLLNVGNKIPVLQEITHSLLVVSCRK